jgi:hypothetical protein
VGVHADTRPEAGHAANLKYEYFEGGQPDQFDAVMARFLDRRV